MINLLEILPKTIIADLATSSGLIATINSYNVNSELRYGILDGIKYNKVFIQGEGELPALFVPLFSTKEGETRYINSITFPKNTSLIFYDYKPEYLSIKAEGLMPFTSGKLVGILNNKEYYTAYDWVYTKDRRKDGYIATIRVAIKLDPSIGSKYKREKQAKKDSGRVIKEMSKVVKSRLKI